ncbi:uncharacterized protein LOC113846042 isoform X3 [Abrus precatorius]|uniref:Uncharacterized protein LOC113846042 isoform X3 n=1 Tax=Abrus precatorius TaxID=3816 RepID=A0A8B8JDX5_ABRPR|nr:uncharacterized protein LOC113846042 isoform X3 [Abrus precatorius]
MDKAPKVRRGNNGFSNTNKRRHINKQSRRHKLFGVFTASIRGDIRFSEKSKKEKLRSLSAVGRALTTCQMACHVSEEQPRHPSSPVIANAKRFKLPKNFFNDCNGVHHASVPRKLRSATKKLSRESVLLDSEKVNHKMNGIESPKKVSIKKCKVSVKQGMRGEWSPREGISGPITKDEEEVAETLYALAGMFPYNGSNHSSGAQDVESLPDNSLVLQESEDNASAALEVPATAQGASPCCPESSPRDASKIVCLNESIGQEQPSLLASAEFLMPSHSISSTMRFQTMSVMVNGENSNKVALHDSELCLAMGLNIPRQSRISENEMKSDVEFEAARDIRQQQHMIKELKGNDGLALWPGLSAGAPAGHAYLQSSATKAPDWLEAAICTYKQDLMETSTCSPSGKISEVGIHKRSWKRCAAHVHISHIIQSLEVPKRQVTKESELFECHQMRAHEGSKSGVLLEVHNITGMGNGIASATVRNPHKSKNVILQQQCHYRDISQATPTPGVYGPQKQNFNFLSLSAGSNGLKVDNNYNKIASRLEPLSKLQVPYFQSLAQQHGVMPIPTAQSQYASTSYPDQLSVAGPQVRMQQPHYYGSPLCGTHYSPTVLNKQEHQSYWGLQQAAQGRSTVNFNIMRTQFPNWQSGRHDSSAVSPCAQTISSSSLPPSRTNGLDLHLPFVCEEIRDRLPNCRSTSHQVQW